MYRVAMIGAGAMARAHLQAFAGQPDVQLVGIHSRTRDKALALATEFNLSVVADSVDELYTQTQADLVVVTVSEPAMKDVGLACLAHNWALLLEKPAGLNVPETETLLQAAQTQELRVYVGMNRRCYATTQAAVTDLAQYDSLRYIVVQDQQNIAFAAEKGFTEPVLSHWMYKNSIHLVDYLRVFGRGNITEVKRLLPWRGPLTSVVLAQVTFDSGDIGLYEGIWDGPAPWAVSVTTAAKRWEMRPLEQATYQNRGENKRNPFEVPAIDVEYKAGFYRQAREVLDALNGQATLVPTLSDSLETMKLVRDIFQEQA